MKNLKLLTISGILLLISGTIHAQDQYRHEFNLNGGAGLSTLQYKPSFGDKALFGFGGNVGLGYTLFFSKQWGLSTGAELTFYNSKTTGDFNTQYLVTNTSGLPGNFYLNSAYKGYEETQEAMFVNIPLMLQFQTRGKHKFYAAAGVKFGIPISASYEIKGGSVTNSGFSDYTNQHYENMPNHGFTEYTINNSSGDLDFKLAYIASIEAGMKWQLSKRWALYTGLYFDYEDNDIRSNAPDKDLIVSNSANPSNYTYNTLIQSRENGADVAEKVAPLALGLKIRISVGCGRNLYEPKKEIVEIIQQTNTEAAIIEETLQDAEQLAREEAARKVAAEKAAAEKERLAQEEAARKAAAEKSAAEKERLAQEEVAQKAAAAEKAAYDRDMQILAKPVNEYNINISDLNNEQTKLLDEKVEVLKRHPEVNVNIEGHTCDLGTVEVNKRGGQQRADKAKNHMINKGISASRITTESKGECCPIVPNDSEANRKINRRVVFVTK